MKTFQYRALVGLSLRDGETDDGDPVEVRVEAGEVIPTRFIDQLPKEWADRKYEKVKNG